MVNITIDFKNNKIYLRRPRLIKGGEYTLTANNNNRGTYVIDNEVKNLLLKGIIALSTKPKILYGKNAYVQYDYTKTEQKGFLKLITDNGEIIHLSIFTGKQSTPHLTFYNTGGVKIHIFIANLFLEDLQHKKYNDFKDLNSTCELFYDLLKLIQNKLHFIHTNDKITDYKMQLSRYITFFMEILQNPSTTEIQDGVVYNVNAKATRMIDDATFKQIINKEIIAKIKAIKDFSDQKASIFNGLTYEINTFIKNNKLTDISNAISAYKKHKCYPITDKNYQFPKYDIFQNQASIDTFITEFEEIKKLVKSVELAKTEQISEDTTLQISEDTSTKYNKIVADITSLNVIFHPNTNVMLDMISNIESTHKTLSPKQIKSLKKFIKTCSTNSPILHEAILKVSGKDLLKTGITESRTDLTTAGGKPKKPLKPKPTLNTKTKPTPNVKTKAKSLIKRRTNSTTPKKK
tara:strand:+ start:486 stop:1871 length:1386 start_codon:yes stop_codon:yes gene_type:complete